ACTRLHSADVLRRHFRHLTLARHGDCPTYRQASFIPLRQGRARACQRDSSWPRTLSTIAATCGISGIEHTRLWRNRAGCWMLIAGSSLAHTSTSAGHRNCWRGNHQPGTATASASVQIWALRLVDEHEILDLW